MDKILFAQWVDLSLLVHGHTHTHSPTRAVVSTSVKWHGHVLVCWPTLFISTLIVCVSVCVSMSLHIETYLSKAI